MTENERRVNAACTAIQNYEQDRDQEEALTDLLSDLMHWADIYAVDFDTMLERARVHHDAEVED